MGLSLGVGVALAAKKKKKSFNTYVAIGDGECNEGIVYEALNYASHYRLKNLCIFLDLNGFMNQQQNVKYLKKETAPNFVHNLKDLSQVLVDCAINDGKKYMVYNQVVSRNVLLNDIETISSNMVNSFEE